MSSSPFELFRRNLKPMMVFLTLLALVSFVILPSIAMYQQQQTGYGTTETTLATTKEGDFELNKVNYFTRNHFATVQFLRELAETTIASGGAPKVADFQYDPQSQMIRSLGINDQPNDQTSVRTMMFAAEAKKAGLELGDPEIKGWLTNFTDGKLSDSQINGILAASSRNQVGQVQLFDQLRQHLLAQTYQRQVLAGLTAGGMPITPPAQQWELFLKLNRRAVADAYGVNVADFIEKTNAKPSEKAINEMYKEGRERFPNLESPDAAFRRPYTAKFEYLAGSLDEFIEREVSNITEEQLKAEYQRRLDGGDFQLPEQPATEDPATEQPAAPAADDAAPPADDAAATETEAAEMTETPAETSDAPPADAAPAEPATPAEPETPTAPETPAEPQTPADPEAPAETEKPAVEAPELNPPSSDAPADAPAAGDSSSLLNREEGVRLVAMRAQESDGETSAAEEPAPAAEEPAAPAEEPAPATEEAKPADATPATDNKPETPAEAPATDAEKPADAPADKPADAPEAAKVESFESVKDEIARSLAQGPAIEKLDAAVTEVNKVMRTYFNARAIAGGKADAAPKRPDLKALAEKLGMKHVVTGMLDGFDVQEEPIAQSFGAGSMMQRGESFVQTMYVTRPPLFTPTRTVDDQARVSYVSWKTDEKEEYIPELKEIREEVITAIRMVEARKLAKAEAEKLAKLFAGSDKPAKELVPAERANQFFESLGPFSWMNSLGFGMRASMGNVEELDRVGDAFMRQVFMSDRGKWGVAPNMPETVFYVVRPTEFSPSTDELYQRFTQAAQRMQTMSLAVEQALRIRDGHYEALDERMGFEWNEKALEQK